MSESKNPYKYGDELINNKKGEEYKVYGIVDDIVFIDYDPPLNSVFKYHWEFLKKFYTLKPSHTWVDITKDNWKEYRDKVVWCQDVVDESIEGKLIYYGSGPRPIVIATKEDTILCGRKASLYNESGDRATWEGEE